MPPDRGTLTGTTVKTRLGVGALVALSIVCCVGLPLLVGAGLGVAAVAWIGGLTLGLVALVVALVLVVVRARRLRAVSCEPQERKERYEQ